MMCCIDRLRSPPKPDTQQFESDEPIPTAFGELVRIIYNDLMECFRE